jgi:hypothetical protein
MNDFYIDKSGLKKLEQFFKDSPQLLRPVTANVLTSLAFNARKQYISSINQSMIVRNRRFVESSLRVQKARSGKIESQIAYSGSIERPRFTGWEEQQTGKQPKKKRAITLAGRRGSKRNIAISKARLKSSNRFYKPQQFSGNTLHSKFMFMMRVLSNRGGGEFIIDRSLTTRKGQLKKGLYQLRGHKINKFQTFDVNKTTRIPWMLTANRKLRFSTDIVKVYNDGIKHIIARYK